MDSKKASRRKFLKGGAAAAAVSAIQSASGQTPASVKRSLKDEVAYGERSRYVTSARVAVLELPRRLTHRGAFRARCEPVPVRGGAGHAGCLR